MRTILFLIVVFFSSFNLENKETWVCHTSINRLGGVTCIMNTFDAKDSLDAEKQFKEYIKRQERKLYGVESKENVHVIFKVDDKKEFVLP